ncbi:hypothetical protein FB451DRAFT_1179060 [Mycena latifolia]|nr:hypothetical protein FB451DRAFT_1179060 [Mycena latifolia]
MPKLTLMELISYFHKESKVSFGRRRLRRKSDYLRHARRAQVLAIEDDPENPVSGWRKSTNYTWLWLHGIGTKQLHVIANMESEYEDEYEYGESKQNLREERIKEQDTEVERRRGPRIERKRRVGTQETEEQDERVREGRRRTQDLLAEIGDIGSKHISASSRVRAQVAELWTQAAQNVAHPAQNGPTHNGSASASASCVSGARESARSGAAMTGEGSGQMSGGRSSGRSGEMRRSRTPVIQGSRTPAWRTRALKRRSAASGARHVATVPALSPGVGVSTPGDKQAPVSVPDHRRVAGIQVVDRIASPFPLSFHMPPLQSFIAHARLRPRAHLVPRRPQSDL